MSVNFLTGSNYGNNPFQTNSIWSNVLFRIIDSYHHKVSPLTRRIVESFFLLSSLLSLFLLIKSHQYLNNVSSNYLSKIPRRSLGDEIIRIELNPKPVQPNYDLIDSYLSEFHQTNHPLSHFVPFPYFRNISGRFCPIQEKFNFFRNTSGNNFQKTTIFEYSTEYSLLRLPPRLRELSGIPVHLVAIEEKNLLPQIDRLYVKLIGLDVLLLHSLARYTNGSIGYARNTVSGFLYSFSGQRVVGLELLALSVLTYTVFTVSLFFLLSFAYTQLYSLIMNILQRLELGRTLSLVRGLFTMILSFVGMELILSDFFQNPVISCYVIIILWVKIQYEALIIHSLAARRVFELNSGICELLFYMHHYRYSGVLDNQALFSCTLFVCHSALYCFHHYALPDFSRMVRDVVTE